MYYGDLYFNPMLLARMTIFDVVLIIMAIVVILVALFYFLSRSAYKKLDEQQAMIESTKMSVSLYVIDKKHDKITNITLPKAAQAQIPKYAKLMKMYFVKAKIGPQIVTLMCDKNVFNGIPLKKNIKAEIAGMYLVSFAGMKSAEEMRKIRKEKKKKEKEEKKKK